MSARAWHYSIGVYFGEAVSSGLLRRSTNEVEARERPAVWFTTAAFEPTIVEARWKFTDGSVFSPKGPAQFRMSGAGLYRAGLTLSRLMPYRDAIRHSNISATRRRKLERIAQDLGSTVFYWHAIFEDVQFTDPDLTIEYFDGRAWCPVGLSDFGKVFAEQADLAEALMLEFIKSRSRA